MAAHKFKKLDVIVALLIAGLFVFSWGAKVGFSWSGTTNTLSSGYMEVDRLNVTSEYYWNSENRTDTLAYPEQVANYVIWNDGTTIFAKNGTTGQIDYSSMNASYIINIALSLSENGIVLLKSGFYSIDAVIQMRNNTCLIGVGNTTIFYAENGLDDSVIENLDHTNGNHNFKIMNLMINGNAINQANVEDISNGITITECWDWEISKVWVYNTQEQGIRIASGSHDGLIQDFKIWDCNWTGLGVTYFNHLVELGNRPHDIRIINGYVENCEEFSVDIEGADLVDVVDVWSVNAPDNGLQLYQTTYGRLINNRIINTKEWAIRSYTSAQAHISGNMVQEFDTENTGNFDGIYIESDRNLVANNHVMSSKGRASIYIHAGQWSSVRNNWVAAWPMAGIINVGGVSLEVEDNYGFVTDNGGTQTCANNENIAHGLAGSPTMVQLTPLNATYDGVPVIANVDWTGVDGTNINVALYWTNGTAISDDVIFVSWATKYEP